MSDVRAQPERTNALPQGEAGVSVWVPLLAFLLLATAIAVTGVFAFEQYKTGAKSEAQVALDSITDLKIRQIEYWLNGHREDAEAVAGDPFLTRAIGSWMRAGRPAGARRASILARLEGIAHAHQFSAAFIVDGQGSVVLATGKDSPSLSPAAHSQALDAMRSGKVGWIDIHADGASGRFAMELVVPVRGAGAHPARAQSAILFHIDPADFLFPLIQSWPIPSKTAETFLFRQEGDAIVYLNPLRHRNDAPLSLRYSVNDPNLLAAQLLRGREGMIEGEDYRKIPVVGYGHRIAGSPWYLISKIDTEEIYAPIERNARGITTAVLGFVFLTGLAIWLWWRQQRAHARLVQMRAEIERQALAKHYDYLTRYANDIILLTDEQGNIVEANDRAAAVYGYAREELLGMNVRQLRAEEAAPSFDQDWERYATQGILFETLHRRKDGSVFPVEINGHTVQVEDSAFHQAVIRDISERRQAEADMRLHSSVFETAGEAVLITDAALRIVAINPAFTEITGYSKAEAIGQTPRLLSSGRQDKAFYERMWASLSETGRWQGEIWNRRKDGQVYPEWESISAVPDAAGNAKNYVAIFSDISERMQDEERRQLLELRLRQSQKLEAIGTLAGGIAHDFNNVISAIIGNVELAREDVGADHHALQSLEEIGKASRRARDLVSQILAFSRQQPQPRQAIALAPLIEEVVKLLRATLPAGIELGATLAADAPSVLADPTQIHQVLMNLCTNAWHAMDEGRGSIHIQLDSAVLGKNAVRIHADLQPGRYARLSVKDSGKGMDAITLERIFEPFFTTKAVGEGTGLGLSVVHGIMRGYQGAITVNSRPGSGTTFHLYFPATDAATETAGAEKTPAAPLRGRGQHVLYLDDDESLVLLVTRMLERGGYRVTGYTESAHALQALRADAARFDLVVTDYNMPGMSGLDVAREVARIRPDLPIVVTSGYITDELRAKAPEAGVRQLVYKPNSAEELCEVVQKLLDEGN